MAEFDPAYLVDHREKDRRVKPGEGENELPYRPPA
jgi:hypothetical protein